ncbi:MAG: peptide ABC transporter substrate-binding protein [Chloroflexia bacterium]|nr:peptide ABC transporter substrate-binding protein [Chloroflexia bacterium]
MSNGPIPQNRVRDAYRQLTAGEIDRRQFMARAGALGLGAGAMSMIVQNAAMAQDASPVASPAATPVVTGGYVRPDAGTDGQTRGEGGELRILVPQGASALSVHNATGGKDIAAGSIISEPLLAYAPDTSLVANLVTEVPSLENGLLASDLSSVTFNLLPGVLWSDGQPFTADDVVFTWEWNVDEANGSIDRVSWELLANVEAVDELTVLATFASPTIGWFQPFGSNIGVIYPRHFWDGKDPVAANTEFASSPIGTGAFVLESLAPNDQVIYLANETYREPNKPFFSRVIIKGGGDAPSAVRAVTSTADWDLAFTLQIDSTALEAALGDQGAVYGPPGTGVEKIQFNFSDPNTEVDGQRSQKDTPHPFLTDKAVRQAINLGINRQVLSDNLYAGEPSEPPGRNILAGMGIYESPNTTWEYDPEAAAAMLDEAGWVLNGNVREKDGMRLSLKYVTTTAEVRQKVQAVVKDNLVDLGFDVELAAIDGGVFFDGSAGNDQNFTHFYSDMQEYTDGATSAFPVNYMKYWYAGPDGENIAQAENDYTGTNKTRYSNADYDAAFDQIAAVATQDEAIDLFIQLNDHVIDEVIEIPLVQLVADRYAASNEFNVDNIAVTAFGDVYWNIANWNKLA